jgi:predicted metal-dependent phosphoesterase TrpH
MSTRQAFDLHCHSTRSDGVLAPAAVVSRAAARGVRTLALTDHDDTGGLDEARAAAQALGLAFVNGVEISVTWNGRTLHVLGLHVDPAHPLLSKGLDRLRSGRHERATRIAAGLEAAGIPGSLSGAQAFVTNPELVGRTHFARYLVAQGRGRDLQAVFRNYLTEGRPGYVPHRWAELAEAVHWIRESGGMAVLAHPGRYAMKGAAREALLEAFVDAGGTGIEVVTGSHSAEQYATWANYARRYGLLASSGSDFHDPAGARDFGRLPGLPPGLQPIWERF